MGGVSLSKTLRSVVHFLVLIIGMWLLLTSLPPASYSQTIANETMCPTPQNVCGCATCGCDTGKPLCPPGQTLYDDYCLPECPGDYVRYPGIPGLCMPPCHHGCPEGYEQVPLPQCPEGYHRNLRDPGECIEDRDRQRYRDNCEYGMSYSSETGQCEVDCPRGYYLDEKGLCQSYYTRECPKDYQRDPDTGKCIPPGVWPPDYSWVCLPLCPPGTYRDIREPTRCIPPPDNCPDGYEDIRGRCLPVCEEGLQRDPYGYCVPPGCKEGTYPNLRGECIPAGCPPGSESVRGQCLPYCEQGWTRDNNGRCRPPERECPQGQRINVQTGQCERIPTGDGCPKNTTYNPRSKKCEPNRPPETKCPEGFKKNADGRCVRIVKQPPCGEGLRLNENGVCEPIRLVPRGCPDGFYFDRKRKRCLPIPEEEDLGDPDPTINRQPGININPELLQQLTPRKKDRGNINIQKECPDGYYRDNNGRCVEFQ